MTDRVCCRSSTAGTKRDLDVEVAIPQDPLSTSPEIPFIRLFLLAVTVEF
ncbi:hypothetical protein TIFTF001_009519 [Ficus carica]|uniref:Uncharacterized protein n=1 Tax=Ficus carica TaxID=3494 RepID=A0AA88DHI1_FICCA|nr:hypothetical protein TIFTF001_009519 [Ficus carica]